MACVDFFRHFARLVKTTIEKRGISKDRGHARKIRAECLIRSNSVMFARNQTRAVLRRAHLRPKCAISWRGNAVESKPGPLMQR